MEALNKKVVGFLGVVSVMQIHDSLFVCSLYDVMVIRYFAIV